MRFWDFNSICSGLFIFFILYSNFLFSDPLVVKGAEGSYIPVVATSWHEKDGGVLMELHEKAPAEDVRNAILDKWPSMNVEIFGKNLFFSSTEIDTLFSFIAGVDIPISIVNSPFSELEDIEIHDFSFENFSHKRPLCKNCAEGEVISREYLSDTEMIINISVDKQSGDKRFSRVKGNIKLLISFSDSSLPDDLEKISDALFAESGDRVEFNFEEHRGKRLFSISEIYSK